VTIENHRVTSFRAYIRNAVMGVHSLIIGYPTEQSEVNYLIIAIKQLYAAAVKGCSSPGLLDASLLLNCRVSTIERDVLQLTLYLFGVS